MRILHIAPNAPYNDYWGYQDNLLPKYHKKLGHDVTIIVTNLMHKDGKLVETACADYTLSDGVRVIRLPKKKYFHHSLTALKSKLDVWPHLLKLKPDFIFYHGLMSDTILDVVKYKRKVNPECVIVQDNHLDYNIGTRCVGVKEKIYRAYHRHINRKSIPYVERVYGVTPWRKTYAEDYFGIPPQKTHVLIMGADDDKIDFLNRESIRKKIREMHSLADSDFVIVTGGKIDRKKNIHLLMEACSGLKGVKLLVFGRVDEDVQSEFDRIIKDSENIEYIGWVEADKVYDYFFAADLGFFPGQHSVLWEQACASKLPCVFERWEGMEHVDVGGNSTFVSPVTIKTLRDKIEELKYTDKFFAMKRAAESPITENYLYSRIAQQSLECVETHGDQ